MTVKKAIKTIDECDKMIKTLEAGIKVINTDNMEETIGISQYMAFMMIDICQDYREMILGTECNIRYGNMEEEVPFP